MVTAALAASFVLAPKATQSQTSPFRVVLLGTGTPVPSTMRLGPSTLVEAGGEKLVFDVGRDVVIRLDQVGIPYGALTGIMLTHLHSDHVSGLPDLWLTGRFGPAGRPVRQTALDVWGPPGTTSMVSHLAEAYKFDISARPPLTPPQGTLVAYHAGTGATLWSAPVGNGAATPVTYELDGRQYVAIAGGRGGDDPTRITAFALPGATPKP